MNYNEEQRSNEAPGTKGGRFRRGHNCAYRAHTCAAGPEPVHSQAPSTQGRACARHVRMATHASRHGCALRQDFCNLKSFSASF